MTSPQRCGVDQAGTSGERAVWQCGGSVCCHGLRREVSAALVLCNLHIACGSAATQPEARSIRSCIVAISPPSFSLNIHHNVTAEWLLYVHSFS